MCGSAMVEVLRSRFCVQCGGSIEEARLSMHPEATWCGVCKKAFELRRGLAPTDHAKPAQPERFDLGQGYSGA